MTEEPESRRYLIDVDSASTPQLFCDCLVIGSGIAGLRAAIEASEKCRVILVCKGNLTESNTQNAQGGIASVLDKTDNFESHIADTLKAGCGLNDKHIVESVVRKAPQLIEQLIEWGTQFDTEAGRLAATLEGGHSRPRVLHAHGDETGRILSETLINKVRSISNIRVMESFFVIDLLTDDQNRCTGVIGRSGKGYRIIWSANTILASGGAGRLYRETTNPSIATGDGLAMAYRAGAVLQDLEFMQFHPTTLYVAGASRALITEALRGEGARLVDGRGQPFMDNYHPDAELAPRDIVSRAILTQMLTSGATHVYLDARSLNKSYFSKRFPMINELCESFDIDVSRQLIPVRPSAHYMIGGVKTGEKTETSIEGLYACGEVAATGLHGANRLGSNSLLEALAFGQIAGQIALQTIKNTEKQFINYKIEPSGRSRLDTADVRNSLRAIMWRNVGITRWEKPLEEAQQIIRFWQRYVMDKTFDSQNGWECQNMLTLCLLMGRAAQQRQESRGVHYRRDFPDTDDVNFRKHIEIHRQDKRKL